MLVRYIIVYKNIELSSTFAPKSVGNIYYEEVAVDDLKSRKLDTFMEILDSKEIEYSRPKYIAVDRIPHLKRYNFDTILDHAQSIWKCSEFYESLVDLSSDYKKELTDMHKSIACVHLPRYLQANYNVKRLWILVLANGRYINSYRPYIPGNYITISKFATIDENDYKHVGRLVDDLEVAVSPITDGSYYKHVPHYAVMPLMVIKCMPVDFSNLRDIDVIFPPKSTERYYSKYKNYPIPVEREFATTYDIRLRTKNDGEDDIYIIFEEHDPTLFPCRDTNDHEYTRATYAYLYVVVDNEILVQKPLTMQFPQDIYFEKINITPEYLFLNIENVFDKTFYRCFYEDTIYVFIAPYPLNQARIRELLENNPPYREIENIIVVNLV